MHVRGSRGMKPVGNDRRNSKSRGRIHINAHIVFEGLYGGISMSIQPFQGCHLVHIPDSPGYHPALFTFNPFRIDYEYKIIHENRYFLRKNPKQGFNNNSPRQKCVYGAGAGETRGKRLPHHKIPRQDSHQRSHRYRGILWKD